MKALKRSMKALLAAAITIYGMAAALPANSQVVNLECETTKPNGEAFIQLGTFNE